MAESESSVAFHNPVKTKPVVVRVKRKAGQERLDAFWLEINDRPVKKQTLDIEGLSISGSKEKAINEAKTKRLLVQHVETVNISDATKDVLQSYLPNLDASKDRKTKIEERKTMHKLDKQKQDQLRSAFRQKHEEIVRNARFEQIWKSRREKIKDGDDSLHEICHLYDVVQVDTEDMNPKEGERQNPISVEEKEILCNYLPLIREYLPLDAHEIESEINSYIFGEGNVKSSMDVETSSAGYVYDLYTVNDADMGDEAATSAYPLVQVDHEDDYYDGPSDIEYETDDSNAENNPMNDYPDEISSEEEKYEEEEFHPYFSKENDYDSEYEDEEVKVSDEEEDDEADWRWNARK